MESEKTMVRPVARKVSCVELFMSDDEAVFLFDGMKLLRGVAKDNHHWDEMRNWEDLMERLKRASIPRWILESSETTSETEPSRSPGA